MALFPSSSRGRPGNTFFFIVIGLCVLSIVFLVTYQMRSMNNLRDETSGRLQQQLDLISVRLREETNLIEKYVKLKEMYSANPVNEVKSEVKPEIPLVQYSSSNDLKIADIMGKNAEPAIKLSTTVLVDKPLIVKTDEQEPEPIINDFSSKSWKNEAAIAKHPILQLDDSDLGSIPLSTMMSWYDPVQGGDSCDGDFGNSLVNRWRHTIKPYCSSEYSNIDCYLVKQTRHSGGGDNLCNGQNIGLKLHPFADPSTTNPVMTSYVNSRHEDQAYIHFNHGSAIQAKCDTDKSLWSPSHFPGWNADWMVGGLDASMTSPIPSLFCDEILDHNALIIQRDTFANFFHSSEDFINAFLAMAILEWNIDDTQILLTDLYPEGPFWDVWNKVYKSKHAPLTAWDLKEKYGDKTICYKNLATGIYGPAAPITVISWYNPCYGSSLVKAYSDLVIRSLDLHEKSIYYGDRDPKIIVITFMARRSSVIWPEKNFCGDESYFKCDLFSHLGTRALSRVVKNEAEAMKALKSLEKVQFDNGARVVVQDADYNLLSFKEQIEMDLRTDIMVGPHGAGLTHTIFLPDRGSLVELFIDGSFANKHFHNLSKWYGRNYVGIDSPNPIDVNNLVNVIMKIVSNMKID